MSQRIISIGLADDDGLGEKQRAAFGKANDNFADLYEGMAALARTVAELQPGSPVLDAIRDLQAAVADRLKPDNALGDLADPAIALANLGGAKSGTNSDITELKGLLKPLAEALGGTGRTSVGQAILEAVVTDTSTGVADTIGNLISGKADAVLVLAVLDATLEALKGIVRKTPAYAALEDYDGVGDWTTDNAPALSRMIADYGQQAVTINLDPAKGYYFSTVPVMPPHWCIDGHTMSPHVLARGECWVPSQNRAIAWWRWKAQPSNGDQIELGRRDPGRTVVTCVSGAPSGNQIRIGATLAETVGNTLTFLNNSQDSQISQCTYTGGFYPLAMQVGAGFGYDFGVIECTHKVPGASGNTFELWHRAVATVAPYEMSLAGENYGGAGAGQAVSAFFQWGGATPVGGSIILPPSATIPQSRGHGFRNLRVINATLPSPLAGPTAMRAAWRTFSGTAFSPAGTTCHSVSHDNVFVAGFDKAVRIVGDRANLKTPRLDCRHGIEILGAFETWEIDRPLANSMAIGNYEYLSMNVLQSYRLGNLVHVHDGGSGGKIREPFSYGHAVTVLIGNEFQIVTTAGATDGNDFRQVTPGLLDITVSNGGTGYTSQARATSSNGDVLAVTVSNGMVCSVIVTDPAPIPAAAAPTVTITDPGGGSGATVTTRYVTTMGYVTYGGCDRHTFMAPASDIKAVAMKFGAIGGFHEVSAPILSGSQFSDIVACPYANVAITGGGLDSRGAASALVVESIHGIVDLAHVRFNKNPNAAPISMPSGAANVRASGYVIDNAETVTALTI